MLNISTVQRSGRDLVCALLQTDESHRLGLLSGGVRDIKSHIFYSSLDWSALSALKLQPPFKPNEHEWDQATTSPADSKRIAAVRVACELDAATCQADSLFAVCVTGATSFYGTRCADQCGPTRHFQRVVTCGALALEAARCKEPRPREASLSSAPTPAVTLEL